MNWRERVSVSISCFGIRFSAVLYITNDPSIQMIQQILGSPVVYQFYDMRFFCPWSIVPPVLHNFLLVHNLLPQSTLIFWWRFRSPVLRGNRINASTHKTWRRLYFFLMFFPYQVIYQKTCQILGFLNIHELCISWNANCHKMARIHDIRDHFWPQNVLF